VIRKVSINLLLGGCLLLTACGPREPAGDEAAWSDVQPIPDTAGAETNAAGSVVQSEAEDYAPLVRRLEEMASVQRAAGETMITGETLVFDYKRRFVRMDQEVRVEDDRGVLETETLMGRFSPENSVELIEARRGVRVTSGGRAARADRATYAFNTGEILLDGAAQLEEGSSRLSGGQIRFRVRGSRRMVCEPDAMLEIADTSELHPEGLGEEGGTTVIRSDRLVYDEEVSIAEFDGHVRVRHPQAALNSGKVRLYLKENNEIDWIEALSGVIIQSDDRKALADRASYYVDENKFVLDGTPKVMQGQNILTGDRITFWQEPPRMVCEPNARVLLYPDEKMKARFLMDLKD
jgi:lipopolysaccharide export system protein LptA